MSIAGVTGMNEYPVMIRLQGKKAVVVGGGRVAERKVGALLEADADVTVISPTLTAVLSDWAAVGFVTWQKKEFEPGDTAGAFLVIAATNNSELNQLVRQSVPMHTLISVVDDPEHSTFLVPSYFRKGRLTVCVSTSGSSPSLAKKIKEELAAQLDDTYEEYAEFLYRCRQIIKQEVPDSQKRQAILAKLLEEPFVRLSRTKQYGERNDCFLQLWRQEMNKKSAD
jgi:precorrin-2 dehydrogenase/sirohydrochlorin ferrochelatase